MSKEKLKPCPFCGSAGEIVRLIDTKQPWVVCTNCRAEININGNYDQQIVIDRWNIRIADAQKLKDIEAIIWHHIDDVRDVEAIMSQIKAKLLNGATDNQRKDA